MTYQKQKLLVRSCSLALVILTLALVSFAQKTDLQAIVSQAAGCIEPQVVDWRHDIRQHPELGNRELRTAPYAGIFPGRR